MHGRVSKNADTAKLMQAGGKAHLGALLAEIQTSKTSQAGILVDLPGYGDDSNESNIHLSWNSLFLFPKSLFLQATLPLKMNLAKPFLHLERNPLEQKALFHILMQDVHGDRWMKQKLMGTWRTVAEQQTAREALVVRLQAD